MCELPPEGQKLHSVPLVLRWLGHASSFLAGGREKGVALLFWDRFNYYYPHFMVMEQLSLQNLVFEGGGMKGLAYVGALEVLHEQRLCAQVERVAGASAGALFAFLVALRLPPKALHELLGALHFEDFLDDSFGMVRDVARLATDFGWYKGQRLLRWLEELLAQYTGLPRCTFAQWEVLRQKHSWCELYVMGSNLSTGFSEVFSARTTPQLPIAAALRISMSIPLFFAAQRNERGEVYVDGGLLDNYPLHLFDRAPFWPPATADRLPPTNPHTLGFRLDGSARIAAFRQGAPTRRRISHFFAYTQALLAALLDQQDNRHLHSDDWQRTVYIDTLGVGATDFTLSPKLQQALILSGRTHTLRYLQWRKTKRLETGGKAWEEGESTKNVLL